MTTTGRTRRIVTRQKLPPWVTKVVPTGMVLAKKAGMSYTLVYRILKGERRPSLDALERLAKVLHLSLDDLMSKIRAIQTKRGKTGVLAAQGVRVAVGRAARRSRG